MIDKKKVLIISYFFPPVSAAASHVINSIVKFFPRKDVCVLRGNPKETYQGSILDSGFHSDVRQYVVDMPSIFRKRSFRIILPVYLDHLFIPAVALRALIIAKRNKVESIFALFPNHYFLIAAYLTHKISGLPLTVYWVDVYHEGRPHFFEKWIAGIFERRILISAKRNYVMTPFLQEYLREKYGIETEVLPIPTELTPAGNRSDDSDAVGGEIKIVFTGRIYDAQLDAIVNMIHALKLLPELNIKLILITPSDKKKLESLGIQGNNVLAFPGKRDDCIAYQRRADILFLPMAFRTASPLVVNLSLPSKVLEYFAAMRPILIHAPSESYITHYAKQRGFAVVVDRPDPIELSDAIRQLIRDREKRNSIVENALLTLREHDARKISHRIQVDLGLIP
jgi:glycosyltransferase involved in cell wall biosynthesis